MDSTEKAIWTVLPQLDEAKLQTLVNELVTKVGVEGPDDLQFIQEDGIKHLLTPIQCRKILNSLKGSEITFALINILVELQQLITKAITQQSFNQHFVKKNKSKFSNSDH